MRRINLPLILDTLFAGFCAFLLFFTILRFYTKNAVIALVFGIVACLLFGALCFLYIRIQQDKKYAISRNEREKRLLSLHLSLSSDGQVLNLLKSCFEEGAFLRGGKIICGEKRYFINFKMSNITEDEVARIIKFKGKGAPEKVLVCNKISPEAEELCISFNIEVMKIDDVYKMLEEKSLLPEKYLYEEKKKPNIFKRIKLRFNRKLTAPLFFSGCALLALSYFTFFPLYYIVCGGIMLILAAVALVFN